MKYALGLLAVLCFVFFTATPAVAQEKSHEGTFVSAAAGKLTMKDKDGKEHSHTIAPDAKITCDGKECKVEDLKPGYKLKVTMKEDQPNTVAKIEATKET
jgi:hypothetical protein